MSNIKEACDAVDEVVAVYLEDYEFCGEDEDGREGTSTPNEYQLMLIKDAIGGLLGDEIFVEIFNAWQDLVRKARPDIEKVSVWERGRQAGAAGTMAGANPYGEWNQRARLSQNEQALIEAAVKHIENHSCVSSCCDAQPSAGEAKALANCLRRALTKAEQT